MVTSQVDPRSALKSYFWVLWKKSEKLELGWTLETITKITSKTKMWCIFCMFSPAGFHRSWCPCHCPQRLSTAANFSSPTKSGRVAESRHLQASLLEMPVPGVPAYCTVNWGSAEQSKQAWLKALWWKKEGGICAWSMFPHTPFIPGFSASLQRDVFEESHIG